MIEASKENKKIYSCFLFFIIGAVKELNSLPDVVSDWLTVQFHQAADVAKLHLQAAVHRKPSCPKSEISLSVFLLL